MCQKCTQISENLSLVSYFRMTQMWHKLDKPICTLMPLSISKYAFLAHLKLNELENKDLRIQTLFNTQFQSVSKMLQLYYRCITIIIILVCFNLPVYALYLA